MLVSPSRFFSTHIHEIQHIGKMPSPITVSIPQRSGARRAKRPWISSCESGRGPIGISQNFTGHRASLAMLEGTVPHHVSGHGQLHDCSKMAKLCFLPSAPQEPCTLWPHDTDTAQRRFQWYAICYLEMSTFEGEEVLKI